MITVKKVKVKRKEDVSNFVDSDTGETLLSKVGDNTSLIFSEDTGMSTISYSNYSVIETEAVVVLSKILNKSDLANVLLMAVTARTSLNVLFNNEIPHTNSTLQKYLAIKSEAMYIALIKRLMNAGVLYQLKGLVCGEKRIVYMINPYLCRKGKVFENKVLEIFTQFKKDIIDG